jgi:hypothetical protein
MDSSVLWQNKNTLTCQLIQSNISNTIQVILSKRSSIDLLMRHLLLFLSCLVLDVSSLSFFFTSLFSSFISLSNNQLSVDNFFVFFLLIFHYSKFGLLKNFHPSLFKNLTAHNIEHWFNFFVEIEQLMILWIDLCSLAILLCWHFWLKEWHWRPI